MTGTGFMKCIPITFSGLFVNAAIFVIEIDEVFDAKTVSGFVTLSRIVKILDLIANYSGAASTMKSQGARSSSLRWKLVLCRISFFYWVFILFLDISLSHQLSMNLRHP